MCVHSNHKVCVRHSMSDTEWNDLFSPDFDPSPPKANTNVSATNGSAITASKLTPEHNPKARDFSPPPDLEGRSDSDSEFDSDSDSSSSSSSSSLAPKQKKDIKHRPNRKRNTREDKRAPLGAQQAMIKIRRA